MAKIHVYKFREIDEVSLFLEGGVLGANIAQPREGPPGVMGLVGLTLTMLVPAGTCTFVAGADPNGLLTFGEIHTQIQAAIATLRVRQLSGRLVFVEVTPTTGASVQAGAAASLLGFDSAANTTGKVFGSPFIAGPVVPYFMQAYSTNDNVHVIYTFELPP